MKKLFACLLAGIMLFAASCAGNPGKETSVPASGEVSEIDPANAPVLVSTGVHLRKSASIAALSLTQIPAGKEVKILSIEGDWARVSYNDTEGYVLLENLEQNGKRVTEAAKDPKESDVPGTSPAENASGSEASETAETSASSEASSADVQSETSGGTEPSSETAPSGQEDTPEAQTDPVPESTDPQPETQPSEGQSSDPGNGVLVDNGLFDLTGLPNNSVPYGNDWDDKDPVGLPNGVHYYDNVYGKYYPVYYIKTDQKLLYLTMDEGYEAGYTPTILDTLRDKGVHAVFFITKQFYDSDPELVQRMINEGHVIGNHTCRHPSGGYPRYVDEHGLDSFTEDVSTLHKLVYDRFGYTMRLFRFPEGEASELLMAKLNNLGYTSVFWSYAHRDYVTDDQPDPQVTLERCVSHMAPGAVYLLHAVSSSNTAALGAFIDQARAAGFEFGDFPVDQVSAR
ncbi:MAG: polysaccharide deacetylase family protein [Lachnospiraceae bacterium]|nr:polysaccharide deacetylase family protein [Lachnospiraceae bacterium]